MTFENADIEHFHTCAASLMRFKDNSQYCDITLNVSGTEFPAHKVILSMFSPYFEALFGGDFKESHESTIRLDGMDPDAFECVLQYIYTGNIENSDFAIAEVYQIADYLQLDELKFNCYMLLMEAIPFDQCISIIRLTKRHHLPGILEEALLIFSEYLDEICHTNGFLELRFDEIIELLQTCDTAEEQIIKMFHAIMSWCKHDLEERTIHVESLLKLIPVQCVNRTLLDAVILKEPIMCEDSRARDWIARNFPIVQIKTKDTNADFFIPTKYKRIFVKHSDNEFVSFDAMSKEFRRLAQIPSQQDLKPVTYKDSIYLFGGVKNQTTWRYNMSDRVWKSIQFSSYSSSETPCVLGDSVYFTGAFFNDTGYNSVCRYNFDDGSVVNYPNLNFDRSLYGVTGHDNCIFVSGGMNYTLPATPELRLAERMDVREAKWSLLPPMDYVQGPCTSAYVSDSLYVSNSHSGLTERFDSRAFKWEVIAQAPWGAGSTVEFDNRLYRVYSKGVAEYIPQSDQWHVIANFEFDSPLAVAF